MKPPTDVPIVRFFLLCVALLAGATAVGVAVLWPGQVEPGVTQGLTAETERAEVSRVESAPCPAPQPGTCTTVEVELRSGPDNGESTTLDLGGEGLAPDVEVGDQVRLARQEVPPANPAELGSGQEAASPTPSPGGTTYTFSDFERTAPMLWLALAFVALVLVFGRLRGALSLLGLGLSLLVILLFIVPAILDGKSPLAVALFGSLAVMLITIALAHGLGPKSLAAILGTSASLLLVALLAVLFTGLANLTGFSSEEATLLSLNQGGISIEGLLLAGIVIGALGVLDDVTVSQASTVLALQTANPDQGFRTLYRRAIEVGRDHVSATVNTLVLAYVGASLPILLLFSSSQIGFGDALNLELVAKEIVATLVGSIGLIAAVPITSALAGFMATRLSSTQLAESDAGHLH